MVHVVRNLVLRLFALQHRLAERVSRVERGLRVIARLSAVAIDLHSRDPRNHSRPVVPGGLRLNRAMLLIALQSPPLQLAVCRWRTYCCFVHNRARRRAASSSRLIAGARGVRGRGTHPSASRWTSTPELRSWCHLSRRTRLRSTITMCAAALYW